MLMGLNRLQKAIRFATEAHFYQKDKQGKPYILHPIRVMLACTTVEEQIVAILHDVLEDCPGKTINNIKDQVFITEQEACAIIALTRLKDKETYSEYIDRLSSNPLAVKVKLLDLEDNTSELRLPIPGNLMRRYMEAKKKLKEISINGNT